MFVIVQDFRFQSHQEQINIGRFQGQQHCICMIVVVAAATTFWNVVDAMGNVAVHGIDALNKRDPEFWILIIIAVPTCRLCDGSSQIQIFVTVLMNGRERQMRRFSKRNEDADFVMCGKYIATRMNKIFKLCPCKLQRYKPGFAVLHTVTLDSIQQFLVTTRVADDGQFWWKHAEKCVFNGSTPCFLNMPEINVALSVVDARCKRRNERIGFEMKIDGAFRASPKITIPNISVSVPFGNFGSYLLFPCQQEHNEK